MEQVNHHRHIFCLQAVGDVVDNIVMLAIENLRDHIAVNALVIGRRAPPAFTVVAQCQLAVEFEVDVRHAALGFEFVDLGLPQVIPILAAIGAEYFREDLAEVGAGIAVPLFVVFPFRCVSNLVAARVGCGPIAINKRAHQNAVARRDGIALRLTGACQYAGGYHAGCCCAGIEPVLQM